MSAAAAPPLLFPPPPPVAGAAAAPPAAAARGGEGGSTDKASPAKKKLSLYLHPFLTLTSCEILAASSLLISNREVQEGGREGGRGQKGECPLGLAAALWATAGARYWSTAPLVTVKRRRRRERVW